MSLLPIIRITEFLEETVTGGTTRPMLVLGEDGNKYVLKIFSKRDAGQRSYTVAEVMANLLAKEFDLVVPDAVYMTIAPELIQLIRQKQPEIYQKLGEKDVDSILFGSLYHEGYPTYSPARKEAAFELYELESIFAFDILIANQDRRSEKPNILKGAQHYLLIDHEKAFEGLTIHLTNFKHGMVPYYFTEHLFYKQLKNAAQTGSSIPFETFEEYFRILNLDKVAENVHFLIQQGYNEVESLSWLHYLQVQKENYRNFVTLLRAKIRE